MTLSARTSAKPGSASQPACSWVHLPWRPRAPHEIQAHRSLMMAQVLPFHALMWQYPVCSLSTSSARTWIVPVWAHSSGAWARPAQRAREQTCHSFVGLIHLEVRRTKKQKPGSLSLIKRQKKYHHQRSLTESYFFPVFVFSLQNSCFPSGCCLCFWATSSKHQLWFLWWKADETY